MALVLQLYNVMSNLFVIKNNKVLTDRFERSINYLRISLTDKCNLRCTYCRPGVHYGVNKQEELLSYEEITELVKITAKLGVTKVRLTGGEPLLRSDISDLVKMISEIEGINDISITTNGIFLKQHATKLKDAGLNRINISIDSLNVDTFRQVTGGELKDVLEGIEAAQYAGLEPIKLNTVLLKGINDHQVSDIIDFSEKNGLIVRFIEAMPMTNGFDWQKRYIEVSEILNRPDVKERLNIDDFEEQTKDPSPAFYINTVGGNKVGFISPMSSRFCSNCNRMRLSSEGRLRSCLPSDSEVDLKQILRGTSANKEEEIIKLIDKSVQMKPEIGTYNLDSNGLKKQMIQIGG